MTVSAEPISAVPAASTDAATTTHPSGGRSLRNPVPPRLSAALLTAVPLAALVLLWYLLTINQVVFWLRFDKIPTPGAVFESFRAQLGTGSYYSNILASTRRILVGFGLATVAGVLIGMAIGRSALVSALVRPVVEVFRPIPAIALVPLAILLFPTGEQGIVFITFFAAFFPVAVSTIHAMHALPKVWEEAARTLGARRGTILFQIALPGALPGIFSGLSVAMGVAWICVISAEMISGQFGIGYFTWQSYGLLDYPSVVVGMLSIGVLGWATAFLVELVGRRVNRWLPRAVR
ncbi:NitT/TauT family transport system permease protein [Nocardia amikacinitolerans]|uniref:NitT/TauT family transport system permease protein n=1 Tax=Nocardia amikacinitolerans TaxID=756689 RepID=A0A285LV81_9NOCA|nr:ABC transporter permease [Nocardia amikacinitolerans]MCP2280062.1 NitT/TauT family transport system permease protein [Nocardia amikacinitolerans]MCP2299876.1 NitT/TauT family transport system permease protein [Nocardia amikacinitolerans]MCP2316698.1 NitT/TauT family transport system permease protein [Nocardia amikacinitolerans]SNY88808.1 NitT/TauT family transport system permease protein [Nocardia amikacinitolerans]